MTELHLSLAGDYVSDIMNELSEIIRIRNGDYTVFLAHSNNFTVSCRLPLHARKLLYVSSTHAKVFGFINYI